MIRLALVGVLAIGAGIAVAAENSVTSNTYECPSNPQDNELRVITFKGELADWLTSAIKRSGALPEAADLGLTLYQSRDGLLQCDATDPAHTFCAIGFAPKSMALEPVPYCE